MARIVPAEDSKVLAGHMLEAAEVNQTILEETIDSAVTGDIRESGRTACGGLDDVRPPHLRMPTAVELASCPVWDMMGFWHTHVTRDQFRNPEHSLPDISNVLFEGAGASIVTGVETSQILYAPEEPEAAREVFRDVLGLEIDSTQDVKVAITEGMVPNPSGARSRLFRQLSPLVERRPTPLIDRQVIESSISSIPPTFSAPGGGEIAYELIECAMDAYQDPVDDTIVRIHNRARSGSDALWMLARRMATAGFDEAIGVVAGTVVSRWLFG